MLPTTYFQVGPKTPIRDRGGRGRTGGREKGKKQKWNKCGKMLKTGKTR